MIASVPKDLAFRPASYRSALISSLGGAGCIALYLWSGGAWDGELRIVAWCLLMVGLLSPKLDQDLGLSFIALTYGLWSALAIIHTNFVVPHEWDFTCVYIDARTLALGLNPYQPADYALALPHIEMPLVPSPVFHEEILEVGFKYLPFSMLLYAPLGWLSYETAHALWVMVNWAAAIYAGYLLYRMSNFQQAGNLAPWLIAALCLLWPASKPAIHFENSHGLMWLAVMLIWRDRQHTRAALWLTLSLLLKPFFVLMVGYFVLRGKWRILAWALLGTICLGAGTWLSFGSEPILSFLFDNPNQRVPDFQYTMLVNHSLLSNLVRWTDFDFSQPHSPLHMPLFWVVGGSLGLIAVVQAIRLPQAQEEWAMALLVATAVIMYPGSLKPYSLMLLPVLLLVWREGTVSLGQYWWIGTLLIGLSMVIMVRYAFWTNVLLWLAALYFPLLMGHKLTRPNIRSNILCLTG
jgi:hypothetical protein